ncbi:MAG: putative Ig domain-containing protein, partial [Acidobacteriia bacterium]|nr:putative Ig domain-containing protein [Terriglobia bacterium]
LPAGTVGVAYVAALGASNGTPPYVFSLAGGSLPDGITLSADGFLTGTPTTAGTSRFTVKVTDSTGGTATKDFSLEIKPAPLALTGTVSDGVVGATISVKFGATGGAPGYLFSASGSLPPGTSFKNDGTLSGTLTAAGSFTFSVTVTDTVGATATRSFTINVTVPPLTIATASLPSGQVGVGYSAQLTATGGTPPYTWSAGGLPGDLSVSSSGVVSGTPASDGTFTVSVTVTDSAKKTATRNFSLVIIPAPLVISTAALPNGTVGVTYQASTAATGGVPPYTWTFTGLPGGVSGAADGTLSGTPLAMGTFSVGATVTDSKGVTASKTFSVTIAPPPLVITTASIPNATVGTAVSLKLAATGGVPPLTWSATGLPANLSVAADGTLSGTPAAPGTTTFTATVKDSAGTSTSKSFQLTVVLPPSPGVNLTGLPPSSNPNTQPRVGVSLPSVYPVDVTVTLTLTFVADSGPDDQKVMFQTGGRSATIVIPAGSTVGANDVGVQVGTVAGTITITTRLTAAGQDITPTPPPTQTLRIIPSAPVIVPPVTATRNSTGFTVAVTGFSSTRELTQAVFQFTAAAGGNLQTSQVTIPVGTLFAGWFQSAASAAFGSQFTLTQPFTVTGSTQIVSVTVTLVNSVGSSGPMSANLQ